MSLGASQFVCIKKIPHQMSWFESYNIVPCRSDWMCKFIFWYGIGGKTASVAFIIVVTLQRYNTLVLRDIISNNRKSGVNILALVN